MHREDLALCLLTREDFSATHELAIHQLCQNQNLGWSRIFHTAEAQRVSPLVHYNIDQATSLHQFVSAPVRANFRRAHIHNILKKKESQRTLAALARCCAENQIDLLLVKGAALALFVQRWPWSVISGDIDVILRPQPEAVHENLARVIDFAERYNHSRGHISEHIEYEPYEHHDVSMNRVLPMTVDDLWQDAVLKEVDGWPVWIQSPEMMLIAACINACRKRYFYLKSLNDIATICRAYQELDWTEIAGRARCYRADAIVFTALTVTKSTLGCSTLPDLFDAFKLNAVRRAAVQQMTALLWRYSSLDALSEQHGGLLGRTLSIPLALTYLSYRFDIVGAKLREVMRARRNPPPGKSTEGRNPRPISFPMIHE